MKKYYTYSDYENYKLANDQVFFCYDLRKKAAGECFQFTIWSEDQLHRLYEEEQIDDVNFRIGLKKSAEKGYSWTRDVSQRHGKSITELKLEGIL